MKLGFLHAIALTGLLGCGSGSRAQLAPPPHRASLLPVDSAVLVKEVRGQVDYAYDSTGWHHLEPGKRLQPGATVRAASGSAAILRLPHSSALYKVSSATTVHITLEPPVQEKTAIVLTARH